MILAMRDQGRFDLVLYNIEERVGPRGELSSNDESEIVGDVVRAMVFPDCIFWSEWRSIAYPAV